MVEPASDGRTEAEVTEWTSLDYVVVDVEGNGRQPPEVVELAAVAVVGGSVGEPQSWLVRPETPIRRFATRIHGLTNQDVADRPSFADISADVLAALEASALVAHNAHVDVDVLRRALPGWQVPEVFDTLTLARRFAPGLDGYRLGNLVEAFNLAENLPEGLSPHRATYDALVTACLFATVATKAATLETLRDDPPGSGEDGAPALFWPPRGPPTRHRRGDRAACARSVAFTTEDGGGCHHHTRASPPPGVEAIVRSSAHLPGRIRFDRLPTRPRRHPRRALCTTVNRRSDPGG